MASGTFLTGGDDPTALDARLQEAIELETDAFGVYTTMRTETQSLFDRILYAIVVVVAFTLGGITTRLGDFLTVTVVLIVVLFLLFQVQHELTSGQRMLAWRIRHAGAGGAVDIASAQLSGTALVLRFGKYMLDQVALFVSVLFVQIVAERLQPSSSDIYAMAGALVPLVIILSVVYVEMQTSAYSCDQTVAASQ
jgi:hypothetical protein